MNKFFKKNKKMKNQKGSMLVLFLLFTTFLFSMIAISVDGGHLFLVKAELKKAADAASLAGAGYLYPTTTDGSPNWDLAEQKALEAVPWNSADGAFLSNATIEVGYWDLTGTIPGIRDPSTVTNPGVDDLPAVRVVIARESGQNGGPVSLFFGPFVGIATKDVSAEAVSGQGGPRSVEPNTLFPMVLPLTLYNQYWDFTNQKPKVDPSTGEVYVFDVNEESAQSRWTTFDSGEVGTQTVIDLMLNGNPNALSIGQEVNTAPGVKAAVYNSVPTGVDVIIPLIASIDSSDTQVIIGFGTMHIHESIGAESKTLTISLGENEKVDGGSIGGSYYGTYVPPKIVY